MVKRLCISVLFDGHNSVDSAVSGGVTITFDLVRAISAAGEVIIIVRLARISRDAGGVFLVWSLAELAFSFFFSFCDMTEVLVLVEVFAGSPVSCCSVG